MCFLQWSIFVVNVNKTITAQATVFYQVNTAKNLLVWKVAQLTEFWRTSLFSLSQLMSCARGVVVVQQLQQILLSKLVTFAIRSICGVFVQIIFSYFPVHQTANRFLYMSIACILNSNFHQQTDIC